MLVRYNREMKPLMPPQTVTLHLGEFDRHGTTRALYKGRWIEVEHGVPGETVRAEIIGQKRPRGKIVDVLKPAPDRVWPPCPYFRDWACGGCQWQMISPEGQIERKQRAVERAMQGAGLDLAVTAVHALTDPWRYRSTAGIALGKHAGFRRHASLAIVPLHDCPISHPSIGRLCATLNDRIESEELPDYHGRVRVDVRVVEAGLQTLIRPSEEGAPLGDVEPLVRELEALDGIAAIAVADPSGTRPVKGDLLAPTLVAGRPVWLAAASFFQTNLLLLPELIARVRQEAEPLTGKRIADVYSGVGVFGLFLAAEASEVVEIEADPLAVEAGRRTAHEWGLTNIRLTAATAEEALRGSERFDALIVNPPRSGLTPPVIEALAESSPPLLLYVSCLPQSLARNLGPLTDAGYSVEQLEIFDFYPQTYHVELLAVLRKST